MFRASRPWLGELETPDEVEAVRQEEASQEMMAEWASDTEGDFEAWREELSSREMMYSGDDVAWENW